MKKLETQGGTIILIDDEDYSKVSAYNWRIKTEKNKKKTYQYVYRNIKNANGKRGREYLHHLIAGIPPIGQTLYFKDGNGLNCQKSNIVFTSYSKKTYRFQKELLSENKFRGVQVYYIAQIKYNNKLMVLGYFKTQKEAAKAYNAKAKELFGDYAVLNEIEDD